jgi:hypothetical protein
MKTTDYWSTVVRTSLHSSPSTCDACQQHWILLLNYKVHVQLLYPDTHEQYKLNFNKGRDVNQFSLNQYRLHSTTDAIQWASCSMPCWQRQCQYNQHLLWPGWHILQRLWCLGRNKPGKRGEATRSIWSRHYLSRYGIYRGILWNSCHQKSWKLWFQ